MSEPITSNPDIQGGEPCIAGTRIPARAIRHFHEDGYSVEQIIAEYPSLTPAQVAAALAFTPAPDELAEAIRTMQDMRENMRGTPTIRFRRERRAITTVLEAISDQGKG